jgi:hypothetical protein
MQGKAANIRPKVVGPCTSRSYMHQAGPLFVDVIYISFQAIGNNMLYVHTN